jgi:hypothetical protein
VEESTGLGVKYLVEWDEDEFGHDVDCLGLSGGGEETPGNEVLNASKRRVPFLWNRCTEDVLHVTV